MKILPYYFRQGAAVLASRIDELAEQVHAALDGGLDASNLQAASIPAGAFAESRGLILLNVDAGAGFVLPAIPALVAQVPVACRIEAAQVQGKGFPLRIGIRVNDVEVAFFSTTRGAPTTTTSKRFTPPLDVPADATLAVSVLPQFTPKPTMLGVFARVCLVLTALPVAP